MSIFRLGGQEPDHSQESITFKGASVRADQKATPGDTATGISNMTVYFGGYGYADEDELSRDLIDLSTFGVLSTNLTDRSDSRGGAEDRFRADGWNQQTKLRIENTGNRVAARTSAA